MPDMKKFLEFYSALGKFLLGAFTGILATITCSFIGFMIFEGFPVFMMPIPILLFSAMTGFVGWTLYRSTKHFPQWWNGLTEAQRAEYEREFTNGERMSDFMILGQRYAFIRHMGTPIAYADIQEVYFLRSKGGTNMYIVLHNGTKHVTKTPLFANEDAIWNELMKRSGQNVSI